MGTSSKVRGPRGGGWSDAVKTAREGIRAGSEPGSSETGAWGRKASSAYREALAETLREDPAAFGLRESLILAGQRLIDTWEELQKEGPAALGVRETEAVAGRDELFAKRFVDVVAGDGSTVVAGAVRRAVAGVAHDRFVEGWGSGRRGRPGPETGTDFSDELFCAIYQSFFADAVSEFLTTVIAENVKLAVPALHLLDPADHIASWTAERLRSLLPMPCEAKAAVGAEASPVTEFARALLEETVDRALGVASGDGGSL